MRLLVALAILVFGFGSAGSARAADLHAGSLARYASYAPMGVIAPPRIVYGFEPGVIVRPYWLPPWRNHHYFPFGRDRWDRHKKLGYVRPRPAQSFHQYWSNAWAFERPLPRYVMPPPPAQPPTLGK